jgi:hypothetical protein
MAEAILAVVSILSMGDSIGRVIANIKEVVDGTRDAERDLRIISDELRVLEEVLDECRIVLDVET